MDAGTQLVAFSGVQASTGHRTDIAAISGLARAVGAIVFVDGSQLVGALPVAHDLPHLDVLTAPDHKFLLNAGRGMGYCYLSPAAQARFTPINAGWRAARIPFDSFFGPRMDLSPTASRFDSSISWLAAIGHQAALTIFDDFGPDASTHATASSPRRCGARSPTSGGSRSTCPNRTRARSSASRSATWNRRRFSLHSRTRESSVRNGTATCG